jgi:phosphoribosylanthranilate isomerase
MALKIKVCGMKYQSNIKALANLLPDYIGFIFYPPSKRFIGVEFDKQDIAHLHPDINKTAVFVDAQLHEVIEFCSLYGVKTLQLHGNETPEYCNALQQKDFTVIKAFGIDESFDFNTIEPYLKHVDFFLFDTKTVEHGGSGKTFNWQVLNNYKFDKPFFLSGGLTLENIENALDLKHKQFYGLDLNSKFEIEPGLKDIEKLNKAFELIRA